MRIDQIKKVARLQRLRREALNGTPRAKSWGGKPVGKSLRREGKRITREW